MLGPPTVAHPLVMGEGSPKGAPTFLLITKQGGEWETQSLVGPFACNTPLTYAVTDRNL